MRRTNLEAIYKLRQQKAELPFGHMKRNLNVDAFLLRGLDGVKAEASLLASCFNIRRMITLIGALALIKKLKHLACPKEEIRENEENNAPASVENSDRREKTWTNRVFVPGRMVEFPFLCQRALF